MKKNRKTKRTRKNIRQKGGGGGNEGHYVNPLNANVNPITKQLVEIISQMHRGELPLASPENTYRNRTNYKKTSQSVISSSYNYPEEYAAARRLSNLAKHTNKYFNNTAGLQGEALLRYISSKSAKSGNSKHTYSNNKITPSPPPLPPPRKQKVPLVKNPLYESPSRFWRNPFARIAKRNKSKKRY